MSVDNSGTATMDPQQGAQAYNDAASVLGGSTAGQFQQSADDVQQQQDPMGPNAPLNGRSGPAPQLQPAPPKKSVLADIAHAIGDVLGGPRTVQRVNPATGAIEEVPLTREGRIANTAGIYLRGAAAGAAQHGPGAVGKAALAGVQEQQQTQQQQQQNTLEDSRNVQLQLRGKASDALINQQIAESGFRMAREGTAIDDATADKFNTMQTMLANDPTNHFVGHFDSFGDLVGNHPELVKAGINIPALQAQGKLRAVITTKNGKSTGVDVFQVNPQWLDQKNADPITVRTPIGLDGEGTPIYQTSVIPAGSVPNSTALQLLGVSGKNELDAQEKAITLKNQTAQSKATVSNLNSEASLRRTQEKNLTSGNAKNEDGTWNPASIPVGLVEGTMDPTQLSKRGTDYNAKLQAANEYSLSKYGKPFDIAQAQSDYKYATNSQNQNTLKMISGMAEPGGAIDIAKGAATALPQLPQATLNKVFNATATEFGSKEATNFHTAMLGLADEYSKVMGGGISSDTGRQQALDILKQSYSKGQINGAFDIMQRDIAARQKALVGSNRYLQKQYQPIAASKAPQAPPAGATHTAPGSDGKQHYTNSQGQDLGVVQ